jgi:hypothetical protein
VTNKLIRDVNEALKSLPGITCSIQTIMLAEPLVPLPRQDRLVTAIKSNADRLIGGPIPAMSAPNERLKLSDLPLASEIVALACYDLLAKGN